MPHIVRRTDTIWAEALPYPSVIAGCRPQTQAGFAGRFGPRRTPALFDEHSGELRARDCLLTLPDHLDDGSRLEDFFVFDRRQCRDPPGADDEGFASGFGRRNHAAKDDPTIVQAESDLLRCADHAAVVCVTRIFSVHDLLLLLAARFRCEGRLTLDL